MSAKNDPTCVRSGTRWYFESGDRTCRERSSIYRCACAIKLILARTIIVNISRTYRPHPAFIDVSSIIGSGYQLSLDILKHRKPVCMVGKLHEGWTTFQEPRY